MVTPALLLLPLLFFRLLVLVLALTWLPPLPPSLEGAMMRIDSPVAATWPKIPALATGNRTTSAAANEDEDDIKSPTTPPVAREASASDLRPASPATLFVVRRVQRNPRARSTMSSVASCHCSRCCEEGKDVEDDEEAPPLPPWIAGDGSAAGRNSATSTCSCRTLTTSIHPSLESSAPAAVAATVAAMASLRRCC